MDLRHRLAHRGKASARAQRSADDGFAAARVEFSTTRTLGTAGVPGFEPLQLPDVATTAQALARVRAGPVQMSRPVVAVDLETAGLTGAVVAFIGCLAWHERERVVVEQFTLTRASSERAFLRAFGDRLREITADGAALLSFNGASFDLPRLRDRMHRLGLPDPARERPHLDLVVAARRLFKGVHADCRQGTLERNVLGVHRRGDIDGAEVAEIFGRLQAHPDDDWVRDDLALAARHNRADVLGLIALLHAVAQALTQPKTPDQALRAARHDARSGRTSRATATLQRVVSPAMGGPMADGPGDGAVLDAAMTLADLHRVAGRYEDAASLWTWVCARAPGHAAAHEALAKHLEHRRRAPAAALRVAAASAEPCPHRLARLRRKAGEISA